MPEIIFKFKNKTQKITVSQSVSPQDLSSLLETNFQLRQKPIGFCDRSGKFYPLAQFSTVRSKTGPYFIVTSKDSTDENMSFASQYYETSKKTNNERFQEPPTAETSLQNVRHPVKGCIGCIGDLALFQQLCLTEDSLTVINCYVDEKPPLDLPYPYYLCQSTQNSTIIYLGTHKVCQFYVPDWSESQVPRVEMFLKGMMPGSFKSPSTKNILQRNPQRLNEQDDRNEQMRENEIKESFLENLNNLLEEDEINELEYYKLKSQVLENPLDFMRKHQMGTRQGLRKDSTSYQYPKDFPARRETTEENEVKYKKEVRPRGISTQNKPDSRSRKTPSRDKLRNRTKKYEIPIIVRKYNNVVEKISTSYPLSLFQEQAINLILELELKGLIGERQAGLFKSLVLQEDREVVSLFEEYFGETLDQIQLANKLKNVGKPFQFYEGESRQPTQSHTRLLIKHSKQQHYQLLRKLAHNREKYVMEAIESFKNSRNQQKFVSRLQKIAEYYKAKEALED